MTAKWARVALFLTFALLVLSTGPSASAETVASREFEDETWDDLPEEGQVAGWHDFRDSDSVRAGLVSTGFAG
ncbi:MAG: hypothetical protein ACRDZM_09570, partial [Acidimicrobiia bacterium]